MHECYFDNIEIKNCGYDSGTYSTSHAASEIGRNAVDAGGNHNHLKHGRISVVYPRYIGIRVLIRVTTKNIHELRFEELIVHGNDTLVGNDQNGDAFLSDEDLFVIGNRMALSETENVGLIKTIWIDKIQIAQVESGRTGLYVGKCMSTYGASVHVASGQFQAGNSAYGVTFDYAAPSYIGGGVNHLNSQGANYVQLIATRGTDDQIHLGDCPIPRSVASDGDDPMVILTGTAASKDQINDSTLRITSHAVWGWIDGY